MRTSNLAERLEEFEAAMKSMDQPAEKAPLVIVQSDSGARPRMPRRPSLSFRRIQIRYSGLRQFRVF